MSIQYSKLLYSYILFLNKLIDKHNKEKNKIPVSVELFTLQGGFYIEKLHGIHKLMMRMMVSTAGKALAEKADRTPTEDDMLDLMTNGGSRVSLKNLEEPVKWCRRMNK